MLAVLTRLETAAALARTSTVIRSKGPCHIFLNVYVVVSDKEE